MKQKSRSDSWRKQVSSRFGWLGETLRSWGNPWLVGLWLLAVIAAVILSFVPGSWISLTRRFPSLPSTLADVIELSSHFFGYAVLVAFISLACKTRTKLVLIYVAAVLIGIVLEMSQIFVPKRGVSLEDLSMNVLGASAGFLFGLARLNRKSRVPLGGQGR